jgi:hypothetical protein
MTDTTTRYKYAPVASHEMVDHSKFEWTRGRAKLGINDEQRANLALKGCAESA